MRGEEGGHSSFLWDTWIIPWGSPYPWGISTTICRWISCNFLSHLPPSGQAVYISQGGVGVEYIYELSRTGSYYILLFLLCRIVAGGSCGVGATTGEESWQKLVMMHQASICISKRIQIWNGRQIVVVEIQKTLCGGRNTVNLIEFTCFYLNLTESMCFI